MATLTTTQEILMKQYQPEKLAALQAERDKKLQETLAFCEGVLAALNLSPEEALLTEASKKANLEKSTTDSPQAHYTANQDEIAKKVRLSEIKLAMNKSKNK